MAFNYRPKSKSEILKKKKTFSLQVAEIYQYILDEYGEVIILDPTTTFKNIKIPRIVKDRKNIAQVKKELSKVTVIKQLAIEFGNGSGAGGSNQNAAETADQENASRMICEHYVKTKKMPLEADIKKIYKKCDDDWYDTFVKQAVAICKYLGSSGYIFSRDKGIMPMVENLALKQCGVSKKDNWNPADIYALKKSSEASVKTKLIEIQKLKLQPSEKLDLLNEVMRVWFKSKELVGISLKKIAKNQTNAKVEQTNVTNTADAIMKNISISGKISCDLTLGTGDEFNTGEMMFKLNVEGKSVTVQIRAFSGGARETTQMDMTGQGEAAKLGKVSSQQAIDPFLSTKKFQRLMAKDLPKVGKWTEVAIKKFVDEFKAIKNVKIGGQSIDWGTDDWETTLRNAIDYEQQNTRTASQLSTKLQCFRWVRIFNQLNKDEFVKFVTILYYGAKKQYSSAGPFLKLS